MAARVMSGKKKKEKKDIIDVQTPSSTIAAKKTTPIPSKKSTSSSSSSSTATETKQVSGHAIAQYAVSLPSLISEAAAGRIPALPELRELSRYRQWQGGVAIFIGQHDLIPPILSQSLHRQLDVMAANPNKDYHPGSRDQVQNLIHPSMYPFVAGRSEWVNDGDAKEFVQAAIKRLSASSLQKAGLPVIARWRQWDRRMRRHTKHNALRRKPRPAPFARYMGNMSHDGNNNGTDVTLPWGPYTDVVINPRDEDFFNDHDHGNHPPSVQLPYGGAAGVKQSIEGFTRMRKTATTTSAPTMTSSSALPSSSAVMAAAAIARAKKPMSVITNNGDARLVETKKHRVSRRMRRYNASYAEKSKASWTNDNEWISAHHSFAHRHTDRREYGWFVGQTQLLGRPYEDSMYQWLPAEFNIDIAGNVTIDSAINSCDRATFPLLYRDIAAIFARMIPMFEQCIGRPLCGTNVQVVVKAANYILRPGETDYQGSWHVEGMSHERIIASGIYYYHTSSHLTGAGLMFRRRMDSGEFGEAERLGRDDDGVVHLGTAPTAMGTCLVFHNSYQHCVDTLTNPSSTEMATRKILCFFVIDPSYRIISTAHVTNTNWTRVTGHHQQLLTAYVPCLPLVIIQLIVGYGMMGMSHDEALDVRTKLMNERKYFVDAHNTQWQRTFSFCEH